MKIITVSVEFNDATPFGTFPSKIEAFDNDQQSVVIEWDGVAVSTNELHEGHEPHYTLKSFLMGDEDYKPAPSLLNFRDSWAAIGELLNVQSDL